MCSVDKDVVALDVAVDDWWVVRVQVYQPLQDLSAPPLDHLEVGRLQFADISNTDSTQNELESCVGSETRRNQQRATRDREGGERAEREGEMQIGRGVHAHTKQIFAFPLIK